MYTECKYKYTSGLAMISKVGSAFQLDIGGGARHRKMHFTKVLADGSLGLTAQWHILPHFPANHKQSP